MAKSSSTSSFDFKRGNKIYHADLKVEPEKNTATYSLHAEIQTKDGKKVFEKDRSGLTHLQVEPAIVFAFHQAFAQ